VKTIAFLPILAAVPQTERPGIVWAEPFWLGLGGPRVWAGTISAGRGVLQGLTRSLGQPGFFRFSPLCHRRCDQ
jgi:hypothetical protein